MRRMEATDVLGSQDHPDGMAMAGKGRIRYVESKWPLVKRKPASRKFRDQSGREFGSLRVVRHLGFRHIFSTYLCQCQCGQLFEVWSTYFHRENRTTHCGCLARKHYDQTAARYHLKYKGVLSAEWLDRSRFAAECMAARSGRFLYRPDESRPLGPDNFAWRDEMPKRSRNKEKAIEFLVANRGLTRGAAEQRVSAVSKQRVQQLARIADGKCFRCRKPRQGRPSLCDECHRKAHPNPRQPSEPGQPRTSRDYRSYPWDFWLDGKPHTLTLGVDVQGFDFRAVAAYYARKRGKRVSIRIAGDTVLIKALPGRTP